MQRDTTQRRAIRAVFRESQRPLSTQELLAATAARRAGVGVATIYRTLKMLLETGWLVAIRVPGEPPRYELADRPHHHHFHCRTCERTFEVLDTEHVCEQLVPGGFVLERHDLLLYGRCSRCVERGESSKARTAGRNG
jgi:Fur family transcriptional regulator, ferric uptake regulator